MKLLSQDWLEIEQGWAKTIVNRGGKSREPGLQKEQLFAATNSAGTKGPMTKSDQFLGDSHIILALPDILITVHINIYLPTAGREFDFIQAMATLHATIDEVSDQYPAALIFFKGMPMPPYLLDSTTNKTRFS